MLLADDLPPAAYADPGFAEFLRARRSRDPHARAAAVRRRLLPARGSRLRRCSCAGAGAGRRRAAAWAALTPAQRAGAGAAAAPTGRRIDADRQAKWLERGRPLPDDAAPTSAARPGSAWPSGHGMTPAERARARLQFQETAPARRPRSGRRAGRPTSALPDDAAQARWPSAPSRRRRRPPRRAAAPTPRGTRSRSPTSCTPPARAAGQAGGARRRPGRPGRDDHADHHAGRAAAAPASRAAQDRRQRRLRRPGDAAAAARAAGRRGTLRRPRPQPRRPAADDRAPAPPTACRPPTPGADRAAWPASSTRACCCSACVMVAGLVYSLA
ncbi:MAG: DUF3619 family protein [Comamonadaceae bacterium]|nr:DUF3619 family protein [Comamonadaceae bacterium]